MQADAEDDPSGSTIASELPRSALTITNPVLPSDFPDPNVVVTRAGYHAFATTSDGRHVQAAHSQDLLHWTEPSEALPALPAWVPAARPDIWAPDVVLDGERAIMAFAGREARTRRMCIGLATSTGVAEPFTPLPTPLLCPTADGGAIDPAILVAEGQAWIYWKTDGNCCGQPVWIMVQQFDMQSLSLVGEPVRLLTPELGWEQGVIEAPDPVVVDGVLYVLYSAGRYADDSYGVGLARCEAITGPCWRESDYPLLVSRLGAIGPGGTSVFTSLDESTWIAYHAWSEAAVGYEAGGARSMWIDRLLLSPSAVRVLGPT